MKARELPQTPAKSTLTSGRVDGVTVGAIAIVVYTVSSILHEAVGHGLTCVLLGGKVSLITSTVCLLPPGERLSQNATRAVFAGGSIMNLVAAVVAWGFLRRLRAASPLVRYFCWLLLAVNGFIGAGYLAVPTLIGFGDWMNVLEGLQPYWAWRAGVVSLGIVLYGLVAWLAGWELQLFLGLETTERRSRAIKLTVIPYLIGGLVFCVAGAFNPVGVKLVVLSAAAASFGGTSGLAWLGSWAAGSTIKIQPPNPPIEFPRNKWWIAAGLGSALLLIGVLGQGVRFKPTQSHQKDSNHRLAFSLAVPFFPAADH